MQQVRIHGPNDVRVDDVEAAAPGPRDAVVRIAACGICGSDLSYIHMGGLGGREPMALGHEMAGVVDEVGAEVHDWQPGDRIIVAPGNDELGRIGNGAIELLERRDLSGVVTHTLPLTDFPAALELLEGSKDCGKVLITIGDDR